MFTSFIVSILAINMFLDTYLWRVEIAKKEKNNIIKYKMNVINWLSQ